MDLSQKIKEAEDEVKLYESRIEAKNQEISDLKGLLKLSEKKIKEYKKIIEKAEKIGNGQ